MKHLLKCPKCEKYTMQEMCPVDSEKTINPKPAKYNPEDRVGDYRRKAKIEILKKRGLL